MKKALTFLTIVVLFISVFLYNQYNMNLSVYCFQVGKADAFLVTIGNQNMLIDTGESDTADTILSYLNKRKIKNIQYLVLTHFDKDHIGGASKIIKNCHVGTIYQSNYPKESQEYDKYLKTIEKEKITPVTVRKTTDIEIGDMIVTLNAPAKEEYSDNPSNNSSLIVEIQDGNENLLFMADAQELRIQEFVQSNTKHFDFIKVPYHGHYQSELSSLFENTKPKVALITSSDEEKEDSQTTRLLKKKKIKTYVTRKNPVLIQCDGSKIKISYQKDKG